MGVKTSGGKKGLNMDTQGFGLNNPKGKNTLLAVHNTWGCALSTEKNVYSEVIQNIKFDSQGTMIGKTAKLCAHPRNLQIDQTRQCCPSKSKPFFFLKGF